MNLRKKKQLIARTLNIGIGRIAFNPERIDEIKEVITKQDVREMVKSKSIIIKEIKGKRKKIKEKKRKHGGKIKKKIREGKKTYIRLARKLRAYLKELKNQGKISKEDYKKTRKQIRAKMFKSKAHLREIKK